VKTVLVQVECGLSIEIDLWREWRVDRQCVAAWCCRSSDVRVVSTSRWWSPGEATSAQTQCTTGWRQLSRRHLSFRDVVRRSSDTP